MTDKDRIEKILQLEQLSSAQFASEIGIQNSTLSHILNGRNNPSLDVLKKILNRYPQISSDWLILGSGTMFRDELKSQSLSLFDNLDLTDSKSIEYISEIPGKNEQVFSGKENDLTNLKDGATHLASNHGHFTENLNEVEKKVKTQHNLDKAVKKIIIYYNDNTFQEFESK